MVVADFHSANGKEVKLGVEKRSKSGVFGKDFVSGGLKDFASRYEEDGYWIYAKCDISPSNIEEILREAVFKELGSRAL